MNQQDASTNTSEPILQDASTNTSVIKSNSQPRMQKPNPYAVGDLGFYAHEKLSRPEIKKIGPILLKQQKHFCKNGCSGASPDAVQFTLRCLTDIIHFQKHLKLNAKQRKILKVLLEPYRKEVLNLSTPSKHKSVVKKLYKQKGGGIFTGILSAIVPLITSLISRLLGKKKK